MGVTSLTVRDQGRDFSKPTGASHQFQLRKFREFIIEMEDLHFHHDSAVMLPDFDTESPTPDATIEPRITALAILAKTLRHAEQNPTQKLILAGHADTSGDANYNVTLSQLRSDNALAALNGDRDGWVKIAEQKHKVEDFQLILKWVARDWGWDCDPGPINNTLNNETRTATKGFQKRYNVEFQKSIAEDGAVGHETWGAFFDVYMVELREVLDADDDAAVNALRQNLHFVDDSKKSVGCGENFPKEARGVDGFRSRENRRVEFVFFDPAEVPLLECHPSRGKCLANLCEVNSTAIFDPTIIPVPPVLPRVVRLRVHLQLVYKDPVASDPDHNFPPDFPVKVEFGDGSPAQNETVIAGGKLNFIVDRRKQSFTLHFDFTPAGAKPGVHFIAVATPASTGTPPDQLVAEAQARAVVDDKFRVFSVPLDWSLSNSDWAVTGAPTFANGSFGQLSGAKDIGSNATPAKMTLDPHWQHFKFQYFDRKIKQKLSIPSIMLEAFFKLNAPAAPATDTDERIRSNWTTTAQACQCIPWILRKRPDGTALANPDQNVSLKFQCLARTFVDSTLGNAGNRRLITIAASGTTLPPADATINAGVAPATPFNPDLPSVGRLDIYDLPTVWRSRMYFATLSGGPAPAAPAAQGFFETLANRATTDDKPLQFSLDDIVLTGPPPSFTPIPLASAVPPAGANPGTPAEHGAIFSHKFASDPNNSNVSAVGVFKTDTNEPWFSQDALFLTPTPPAPDPNYNRNYVADYPDWTRAVIAKGSIFDAFDQRTPDTANHVVGARAAVRWVDQTVAPNFIVPQQTNAAGAITNPGIMNARPTPITPPGAGFYVIHPFYEQRHRRGTVFTPTREEGTGRYDLALLRCCDVGGSANDTEVAICMNYFRFCFNFNKPVFANNNNLNVGLNPTTFNAGQQRTYIQNSMRNIPQRWNGPDPAAGGAPFVQTGGTELVCSTGRPEMTPKSGNPKLRVDGMWFAQAFPTTAIAHFEMNVYQNGRAFMASDRGFGNLGPTDDAPLAVAAGFPAGSFTFAHENGHGGSLGDEYIESAMSASYGRDGFANNTPGSPFSPDLVGIMCSNMQRTTARYYWHLAEWLRFVIGGSPPIDFQIKHAGSTYEIPHVTTFGGTGQPSVAARPFQYTHVNWPMVETLNATLGTRGQFDLYLYPLGSEDYPNRALVPGSTPFDGILVVLVKMQFALHTTNITNMINILGQIDANINLVFNGTTPFSASGTNGGRTFNRCLIRFMPRYLASTFSVLPSPATPAITSQHNNYVAGLQLQTGETYANRVSLISGNHPAHFQVTTAAAGASSFTALRSLTFNAGTPANFPGFFGEMVGLAAGAAVNAANVQPIAQLVFGGGTPVTPDPNLPEIDVAPLSLAFGNRASGSGASAVQKFSISNIGRGQLNFTSMNITGTNAAEFQFQPIIAIGNIPGGGKRDIGIVFSPTSAGAKTASVTIVTDDADEPTVNVALTGTGT
jgi:hypothetical protein